MPSLPSRLFLKTVPELSAAVRSGRFDILLTLTVQGRPCLIRGYDESNRSVPLGTLQLSNRIEHHFSTQEINFRCRGSCTLIKGNETPLRTVSTFGRHDSSHPAVWPWKRARERVEEMHGCPEDPAAVPGGAEAWLCFWKRGGEEGVPRGWARLVTVATEWRAGMLHAGWRIDAAPAGCLALSRYGKPAKCARSEQGCFCCRGSGTRHLIEPLAYDLLLRVEHRHITAETYGWIDMYSSVLTAEQCSARLSHKHATKRWNEALSVSKQTPPGGPIVTKRGPEITAGNTANEIFVVETLHQQDVQRWGRAVRRHKSSHQPMASWTSTLASHQGEPRSFPGWVTGFSQVRTVSDDAVGRRVFSEIRPPPPPLHSGAAPYSLQSPSKGKWRSLDAAVPCGASDLLCTSCARPRTYLLLSVVVSRCARMLEAERAWIRAYLQRHVERTGQQLEVADPVPFESQSFEFYCPLVRMVARGSSSTTPPVTAADEGLRGAALLISSQNADLYLSANQQIILCTNTDIIRPEVGGASRERRPQQWNSGATGKRGDFRGSPLFSQSHAVNQRELGAPPLSHKNNFLELDRAIKTGTSNSTRAAAVPPRELLLRGLPVLPPRRTAIGGREGLDQIKAIGSLFPKLFCTRGDDDQCLLALEDMTPQGSVLAPTTYIAKKKNNPETFFDVVKRFDPWDEEMCGKFSVLIRGMARHSAEVFRAEFPGDGEKCLTEPEEPLAVLCLGDYNRNNAMFAYDAEGGPSFLKVLDFQLSTYSSLLLFMSTSPEVREAHWGELTLFCERYVLEQHVVTPGLKPVAPRSGLVLPLYTILRRDGLQGRASASRGDGGRQLVSCEDTWIIPRRRSFVRGRRIIQ
ncbi:hypothetical protein PR048_030260 [Dryococelus australis]|uniref:CHK kinase-like domain-containing protein n=1 Tax=Dryococelus australis TaxID=614101 RepID=A0ABQ9GB47_9NEOP|nr:hypothetical protein PR048_030260 [Dryococelus australis]